MGGVQACTPRLAKPLESECCNPEMCNQGVAALTDQECADILLVNGTVRGELEDVRRALSHGARPNTLADLTVKMGTPKTSTYKATMVSTTPLMRTCMSGHVEIMDLLLEAKATPTLCDHRGWNALCHALSMGEVDLARRLLTLTERRRDMQTQVAIVHRSDIIDVCRKSVSQKAADAVQEEFTAGFVKAAT